MRQAIQTQQAPTAIGSYSQAIRAGNTIYLSGQIPLDPATQAIVNGGIAEQVKQVFENIKHLAIASGGDLDHVVKLTVYLTDLSHINYINDTIAHYFKTPYPARTTIQVSALPKQAAVEVEALMVF